MITRLWLFIGIGASLILTSGCQNTGEGMKEDTSNMQKEGQKMGDNVAEGTRDTMAAVDLTPKIKSAIISNPMLNDEKNLVNVDSSEESVTLTGHVTSQELKDTAGKLAEQVIFESNAKQKLKNELVVQP